MKKRITITERGTITIPAKMRAAYGINANDELIIENTPQGILLRPAFSVPIEAYSEQRIQKFASEDDTIGRILSDTPPNDQSP